MWGFFRHCNVLAGKHNNNRGASCIKSDAVRIGPLTQGLKEITTFSDIQEKKITVCISLENHGPHIAVVDILRKKKLVESEQIYKYFSILTIRVHCLTLIIYYIYE